MIDILKAVAVVSVAAFLAGCEFKKEHNGDTYIIGAENGSTQNVTIDNSTQKDDADVTEEKALDADFAKDKQAAETVQQVYNGEKQKEYFTDIDRYK